MCDISADIKTNFIHHFSETSGKIIYQLITKTSAYLAWMLVNCYFELWV